MCDGLDHINVFSRGQTALGRGLSNFAHTPFEHPSFGAFKSIEGLWYWLGSRDDRLRALSGYAAKALGRSLPITSRLDKAEFELQVLRGVTAKLEAFPDLDAELKRCRLPLKHYYVFGDKKVPAHSGQFIIKFLEERRVS